MAVEFRANIEEDYAGGWFIRLTDTLAQESVSCGSIEEFSDHIESMGGKYANDIKVVWSKNSDVTSEHFSEVYHAMEKIKSEIGSEG